MEAVEMVEVSTVLVNLSTVHGQEMLKRNEVPRLGF